MKNIVSSYVEQFRQDRQKQVRLAAVLAVFAVVVAGIVFWQLHTTGVAMTNEVFCGQEEHVHDDGCYEQVLICNNGEEGHVHDDSCYETVLTCRIPEHIHTVACLTDETADVETTDVWEATLPELTGNWAENMTAVAESQLGYTESTANFILADDGETHMGYTRYGAWYGNEYGNWDAMFVSFCLHYAGVPEDVMPENSGAYAMYASLRDMGLFKDSADFTPAAGDLVFLDQDGDGGIDSVGIVEMISGDGTALSVIEGNSNDAVERNQYAADEGGSVVGYAVLPDSSVDEAAAAVSDEPEKSYQGTDADEEQTLTYDRLCESMADLYRKGLDLEDPEEAENLWNALMDIWEQIYAALEDGSLSLTDQEQDNLDSLTDAIYACVVLAGFDPYATRSLDDYRVEIMGTFTLNGTDWTASSSDGGEVRLTTSGNITTVYGWTPGTVTLTSGSTTHTVTISDTVRVCVYVSSGNVSAEMLELLGIDSSTVDAYGYFPAGVVYVDASYFTEEKKTELFNASSSAREKVALIETEEDWQELLVDLQQMDTSADVFTDNNKGNAGNKVADYFEDAQDYLGHGSSSGATGFFYSPGGSGYASSFSDVNFHFDLLFSVSHVTYVYGNNGISDGQGADDGNTAIGQTAYISGVTIDEANPNFLIPDGYVFEGYYTDADFENHWDSSQRLTGDMTIYIKLTAGLEITVDKVDADTKEHLAGAQFLLGKVVEEELYENGVPTGETGAFTYYYDPDEYSGWISERDQAIPYTTTGEQGNFQMTLAGCPEGEITFCYFLEEVAAPDGYALWDEQIVFIVINEADSQEVRIISPEDSNMVSVDNETFTITVSNEPDTFDVLIYKYADNGESNDNPSTTSLRNYNIENYDVSYSDPLEGAEFILSRNVTQDDGSETTEYVVTSSETDESGRIYYTITGWTEDPGQASTLVTDPSGYIELLNMEAGTYTLTETKAPDGYFLLTENIVFTVSSEGEVSVVSGPAEIDSDSEDTWITIANEEIIPGAFELQKTDKNGNILTGAEFILGYFWNYEIDSPEYFPISPDGEYGYCYGILNYDDTYGIYVFDWDNYSETRESATTLKVDENGIIRIKNLPHSDEYETGFFLIETKAPDGYALLEDPIVFTVNSDGTIKIVVDNGYVSMNDEGTVMTAENIAGRELPYTGGIGTWIYTAAGVILTGSAATLLVYRKRRAVRS